MGTEALRFVEGYRPAFGSRNPHTRVTELVVDDWTIIRLERCTYNRRTEFQSRKGNETLCFTVGDFDLLYDGDDAIIKRHRDALNRYHKAVLQRQTDRNEFAQFQGKGYW